MKRMKSTSCFMLSFLLMAMLVMVISCTNEAKQSYDRLMSELSYDDLSSYDLQSLMSFSERIENHLNNYPDYRENGNLVNFKDRIITITDNKVFLEIVSMAEQVRNEKYNDYDEGVESINNCINKLNHYCKDGKSKENRSKAEKLLSMFRNQISSIAEERERYYNAIYSNNISDLESFIRSYPNSVMKGSVIERMDQLYYSDFLNNFNSSPNTIDQLNRSVNVAKNFLSKVQSIEVKNQVSEAISNLEGSRRAVMECELNDKLQDLMDMMESVAKDKAEQKHPAYKVEMCSARGSNPEIVGNSSTFERIYMVSMKGAFFGIDKRELIVAISGKISGNLNTGVSVQITGSRIEADKKF